MIHILCHFFFFQAEDGIRDGHVTGVQTCALPISDPEATSDRQAIGDHVYNFCFPMDGVRFTPSTQPQRIRPTMPWPTGTRSEERRVGKESRGQRAPEE